MRAEQRKLCQEIFISVCRDSKFSMDAVKAAKFAAAVIGTHPLVIWAAMDMETMDRIAEGSHPVCRT